MTPERWQQIEEIFHEALELGEAEREGFVSERSGDDQELKSEVEKLLSQFVEASSFIEQPLYDSAKGGVLSALLDETDEDPMVGKVLGSYRIEREIGRGGMGAVYEAVRADGEFRLRVALKVVKRGVDTDFVLRRFRNERQILAALDHPFITRLIDGGTTDDGRPYFVMEYIDGMPLYRYCDRQRLSVSDRLRLFCRVCEAVEYAHQKLVIHRDLKPSNIFITNDGTPRLLDFGIAKLLDPNLAIDTLQPTATALRMMTVDYASPEQVRGEKVTYATDVYSLGVILFELLTGYRPYKIESRSPHDVARAICDDEPAIASEAARGTTGAQVVRVNPSAATLIGTADLRGESPTGLSEELRGNLDGIIAKAMRKSPEERYRSVKDLREDIECHLRGEAVDVESPRSADEIPVPTVLDPDTCLVAVLPLSLMSPAGQGTTDETYLTVGLADAIITRLASVQRLTVRPTSSITRYNEHQINPFRAGLELGVDFVLDGRIRRFGERLRISLQLLDIKKMSAIWAGQFDEHLTDVLELEDAISEQVAAALIPQLTGEDKQKLSKRGTNDPRAYEAFLRGRFYWNQFTSQSLPKALEAYQTAISYDPDYALAHVAIADFYIWANIYGLIPCAVSYVNSEASVRRALQIDGELGEAYASMALIMANRFEFEKAESLYRKALELNPHYAQTHEWYAALLIGVGRYDEGLAHMYRAEDLDPLSLRTKILVVWCCYQAGKFEAALAKAEEVVELDGNYPQGHLQRGYALCELGRADEGVASIEHAIMLMPGSALTEYHLCFAYASAGRGADAVRVADEMELRSRTEHVKPMFLFYANVAAGRLDKAFEYLETGVDEFDPWLVWLGTEVKLKKIQDEGRYIQLLERTRRRIVDGRVRLIAESAFGHTSIKLSEAVTAPMEENRTSDLKLGFVSRHRFKFAGAGLIAVLIVVGFLSGILTLHIGDGPVPRVAAPEPVSRSIAVLPFVNETGDAANDYVSQGMSESLMSRLAAFPDVRIVTKAAVASLKTRDLDAQGIGRELGVENVIAGTLSNENGDFVLRIVMISVDDGKTKLTMSFGERPERIFALQETMSSKMIEALNLQTSTRPVAARSYTENNEAFQLYLKGEYSRQKGTPASTNESIELYRRAIALDPNYALAYQGLALAYRSAPAYGSLSPQEAFPKAKDAAQKALAIDPAMSTAYVSLASIKATYDWDFAGAETEYKRAIQIAPNNSEAHYSYGNFLVAMGRTDEALNEFRSALQIDPLSLNIQTNIGWAQYIAGNYDAALLQVRQVIDRDPTFARAYLNLGEILQEEGKMDEAIRAYKTIRDLSHDPLADMALGHAYAVAGQRSEAEKIAADLEDRVRRKEVSSFLPAVVYAGMNEKDKSFYWLERAYQERSNWLTLIKVGRRLKNLRGDPRFDDLLKRVGFPE